MLIICDNISFHKYRLQNIPSFVSIHYIGLVLGRPSVAMGRCPTRAQCLQVLVGMLGSYSVHLCIFPLHYNLRFLGWVAVGDWVVVSWFRVSDSVLMLLIRYFAWCCWQTWVFLLHMLQDTQIACNIDTRWFFISKLSTFAHS